MLASLRAKWPEARIDWVIQAGFEDAAKSHPMLDGVVLFPRKAFQGWWWKSSVARAVLRWGKELRLARYDLVLDCQGLGRSGVMTWATRSPRRAGLRSAREGAWMFYNRRHPDSPSRHTVDEMLWLLECEGIEPVRDMRLYVNDADEAWWGERREALGLKNGYAVLAPTTRWKSKRWPIEWWHELLAPLREHGLKHAVAIGAPGERAQVAPLIERDGVIDLVGASSVGQTMAIVRSASIIIANDSAPLHMAVGFDTPAIGLYGPTDPARVGPYTQGNVGRNTHVLRGAISQESSSRGRINFRDDSLGDSLMRTMTPAMVGKQIHAVLATSEQRMANKRSTREVQPKVGPKDSGIGNEAGWAQATVERP